MKHRHADLHAWLSNCSFHTGSSDTLSSIDSSESSVTSLADECLNRTNRRRRKPHVHIVKNLSYDINVSQTSGPVAIGSKTANITSHSHSRGAEGSDLLIADSSSPVNSTTNFQSEQDRLQEENGVQFGKPIPGSYCLNSHSKLHCVEKEETWKPGPSSGIRTNNGDEECPWTIESFFDDPDCFIQEMNKSADVSKERREQFILLKILPHLERKWGKCSSSNEEVYKILAKVSRSINSGKVVKHALQLLFHLICKANFRSGNDNLLVVEDVIRSSMFTKDEHSEGYLKYIVYSRILSLLLMRQVRHETLPIVALENDLKSVQKELRRYIQNKVKKDHFRYSVEFILDTINRLLTLHDKSIVPSEMKDLIEECEEFCGNSKMQSKDLKIIQKLETKKKIQRIDLHCTLIHLHGKVHCERSVPQVKTERRAMKLIRLIVEAYLKGGGGGDWRFCLLASSILVDIAKNNVTKEIRKEAGGCLVNFLKDEKGQKKPECRALLQKQSSQLLLCLDRETRTFLVHFLSKNRQSEEALPANLHTEHLSSMYSTQTLEINETIVHKSSSCFINHGMFQRKKVAVKVLYVKKNHLLEEDLHLQPRERLIREVYNMRRLNASQHPNYFPALFGYDTKSFPYHVITGFEKYGDLLQFLRMSRERDTHLKPIDLLRMLINISCALLYLEELGLVHRAAMAENVLVGDNYVCKLSGLHSLQQLTRGKDEESNSLEGYCSVVPEFVSTSNDDDLPVRWKAPECLTDYRYSTASDVWAFGVLMYEVLTYGCTPYRHVWDDKHVPSRVVDREEIVLQETCFINSEYELMKQCCEYKPQRRLKLSEVNKRLDELLDQTEEDEKRPDPPPLIMQQATFGSYDVEDDDELHGSISGDEKSPWTISSFCDDPDCFIQEMNKSVGERREQREEFVLRKILPHLERRWGKCSSSNAEVCKILAKVSCSINSGKVVKHALQMLFYLIFKANFGSGNDKLLNVEAVMRSSMLTKAEHSEGNLKFVVYSRILSLLLIQHVCQEKLPIVTLENDLKSVQELLRPLIKGSVKKDQFRYSVEFILKTIDRLLKQHDKSIWPTKLKDLLEECHEFCANSRMQSKDLKINHALETKKNVEWIDRHCILIDLHGKVHSKRPVPQIKTERRAMKLIRLIVEAYLKGGGGGDWRFCLLASSILVDIAKNNVTKELRKKAGGCLVNLLEDAELQKRPECREILQQQSSELLFCPDREIRIFLVHSLSKNRQSEEAFPANIHIERLSSMYRTQNLEINEEIVHRSSSCFINEGMFQGKEVAVKVLFVKKNHLLEEDPKFQARERLIREVHNMRRLNTSQHSNYFPVLLGYDTKSFPYHLITRFETWGDLLQVVQMSRESEPHLKPVDLFKMLINISHALFHLEELGLVHRAVMAENVLVGDNYVCKLSGLHSLRQFTRGTSSQDEELNSLEGCCSAELVVPEYISTSNDEDLPVRWKAPECLTRCRYSTASDVWAFGVLMYEVLTYGCSPYRHVLDDNEVPFRVVDLEEIVCQEKCFINSEYELMKQCCEYNPHHRPKLSEVNKRLDKLLHKTEEDEERPDPPPLKIQQGEATCGSSDVEDDDESYSNISDITSVCKECNLESAEEDQDETADLYDDVKIDSGSARILERILHEDDQHIGRLVGLHNPNLASIWIDVDSQYWIVSF